MTDRSKLIPEISYEQVIEQEKHQEIESSTYWQKVSKFYEKVYDGMEYTAYIASGHDPIIVMSRIFLFIKRHKIIFTILSLAGPISYLFRLFLTLMR